MVTWAHLAGSNTTGTSCRHWTCCYTLLNYITHSYTRYISNHPILTSRTMDPLHSPHPHQTLPNTHFRHQPLHITPFNKTFHTPRAKLHTLTTPTICTLNTPPHIQLSAMSQSLQLLVLGLAALSALPRVPTCLV